ncbi:MAG: hypothetical protein ACRC6K_00110 [Fusobacteriaceae bacterium]
MKLETFPHRIKLLLIDEYEGEENVKNKIELYKLETNTSLKALGVNINLLTPEEKKLLEELYITYKLFSVLEMEKIAEDKRIDYYKLVKSISERENKPNILKTKGLVIF